ncbi:MAG: hypothetical protein VX768_00685 [Planctomycetota bacterium]|nr:hypothetical protein [Planctomycetota bacterium]
MFESVKKLFSSQHRQGKTGRCCCFHFGRCGSTLLGNMLDRHSKISWGGELFHALHEPAQPDTAIRGPEDALSLLDQALQHCRSPWYGFETKFQHLDPNGLNKGLEEFIAHLRERGFHYFILLKRKNYLRQAISVARGQQTRQWHFQTGTPSPGVRAVSLDPERLGLGGTDREMIECFHFLDQTYLEAEATLNAHHCNWIQLEYETDLESDPRGGFQKVASFLGLDPETPDACLQKIGGQPLAEMLDNLDAVSNRLTGTAYQWMLHE